MGSACELAWLTLKLELSTKNLHGHCSLPYSPQTPALYCTVPVLEMAGLWPHLMRDVRVRDVPMRDVPALVGRTGDVFTGGKDAHAEKTLSHLCLFPFCFLSLVVSFSSSLPGLAFASFSSLPFRSTQYKSTILIST